MDPEGLLQCSKKPATGNYREPFRPYFLKIHFIITFYLRLRAKYPAVFILLQLITLIIQWDEKILCSFLQFSITSPLLGENILFSTLFPNTINILSFLWQNTLFKQRTSSSID
jgi:hypothetical protein